MLKWIEFVEYLLGQMIVMEGETHSHIHNIM
jgi:hypothetical protein